MTQKNQQPSAYGHEQGSWLPEKTEDKQDETTGAGGEPEEPESPTFCEERDGGRGDADLKSGDRSRERFVFPKKMFRFLSLGLGVRFRRGLFI